MKLKYTLQIYNILSEFGHITNVFIGVYFLFVCGLFYAMFCCAFLFHYLVRLCHKSYVTLKFLSYFENMEQGKEKKFLHD